MKDKTVPLTISRVASFIKFFIFCFLPYFLGSLNMLAIDYLSEVLNSHFAYFVSPWFLSARLVSDSWLTLMLSVDVLLASETRSHCSGFLVLPHCVPAAHGCSLSE